jgi:type II secretory pathway pseudopilin PulG
MAVERDKGDTIVEVLISITIASLILAAAYAIATRSLNQGISARERTQALYYLQGQVETLKLREQRSTTQQFNTFLTTNNFCLNQDSTGPNDTTNVWTPIANSGSPDLLGTNYNASCVRPGNYYINITKNSPGIPGSQPTYLFTARWDRIGGGQNQSQLYYRF